MISGQRAAGAPSSNVAEARAGDLARAALRATDSSLFWAVAFLVAVLGGAAAGFHLPTSGDSFVHIATGRILEDRGLLGTSSFMAGSAVPLDLRSWLLDLGLAHLYSLGGVAALEALAAVMGALTGLLMVAAARMMGRAHALMVVAMVGLALAALDPAISSLSAVVMALLASSALLCLAAVRQGRGWAPWALLAVVVVWANVDPSVVVVAPLTALILVVDRLSSHPHRRGLWLAPAVLVASCINPQGPLLYAWAPLSLGMLGEHPLLPLWSSPDFHPWGARISELTALALLLGYLVGGSSRRRSDGLLAMTVAVLTLVWSDYLPLFLVVAGVLAASLLSNWTAEFAPAQRRRPVVAGNRWRLVAMLPVLLTVVLLGRAVVHAEASGGPSEQLAARLPVAAASWLRSHQTVGTIYTTPDFGDYLAAADPTAHNLLCTTDPVADGETRMTACEELAVLDHGALAVLRRLGATEAVLPRAAPEVAFLRAEGWSISYRDRVAEVLAAPPSRR